MHDHKIGTLVVCNASKHPVGIITDRDLAVRIVAAGRDPNITVIAEVMTESPTVICEDASIESALSHMRAGPFRRLPVVNKKGVMVGMISLDDILSLLTKEFYDIGGLLNRENPASLSVPYVMR